MQGRGWTHPRKEGPYALAPRVPFERAHGDRREGYGSGYPYTLVETLEEATHQATEMAVSRGESGAVVLLSPACASFDQFRDFEERGEAFCRYIKKNCDNQLETLAKCR